MTMSAEVFKHWQDKKRESLTHAYLEISCNGEWCPTYRHSFLRRISERRSGRLSAIFMEVMICLFDNL